MKLPRVTYLVYESDGIQTLKADKEPLFYSLSYTSSISTLT